MKSSVGKLKSRRLSLTGKNSLTGFLFTLPFCIGLLLFFLPNFIQGVVFAFNQVGFEPGGFTLTYVGWDNFYYAFRTDLDYSNNLISSITSLLYQVPVIVVSSIFFATILNRKFFGRIFVRGVFFLPVIIATGVVMKYFQLDSVTYGVLRGSTETSAIFSSSAIEEILINSGLNDGLVKVFVTISTNIFDLMWRTGIQTLILLAGIQSVPASLYEASSIEGASAWDNYWYITIPMLSPMIFVSLVYTVVDTFSDATNPVMSQIQTLVTSLDNGKASAMAIPFMLIILLVLALIFGVFALINRNSNPEKARR